MGKDREITIKEGAFNNYYASLRPLEDAGKLLSLHHSEEMRTRITYYLNLYHHFGKGLFECWIC